MQAMILAAGFGTRLRPFTNFKPKPVFPVLNQSLLKLTIKRLQQYGFSHIIVNCHYLKEQIIEEIEDIPGVVIQQEEKILGTGGGLRKALALMRDEPVLVTNGDIYHTIPYDKLYHNHQQKNAEVTLGIHDYPRFNTIQTRKQQVVSFDPQKKDNQILAFTGIHVLNPVHLERLVENSFSCIIDLYRALIQDSYDISSYRTDRFFWRDMGTVEDYLLLHKDLLEQNVPRWQGMTTEESLNLIGSNVELGDCKFEGWCVIGDNVKIGDQVLIKDSVIWADQKIESGVKIENMLYYQRN